MEERRRPCNPDLCPDHLAHSQALTAGTERFKTMDIKLDVMGGKIDNFIAWKAEMRGVWLASVFLVGFFGSLISIAFGGIATYYTIHKLIHKDIVALVK